jgi:hypothetical protein
VGVYYAYILRTMTPMISQLKERVNTKITGGGTVSEHASATRLFQALDSAGFETQAEAAEAMGISPGWLSQLKNGAQRVTAKTAAAAEHVTGFSRRWILTGEGAQKVEDQGAVVLNTESAAQVDEGPAKPVRVTRWHCGSCGLEIRPTYEVCPYCGRPLDWEVLREGTA